MVDPDAEVVGVEDAEDGQDHLFCHVLKLRKYSCTVVPLILRGVGVSV